MAPINTINITPRLLNTSCAWSSSLEDLQALYNSRYTGAITTRTATLDGFQENDTHIVKFAATGTSTVNSYGYSPHPLSQYLEWVESILKDTTGDKPIIISITASSADSLEKMVSSIQELRVRVKDAERSQGGHSRIAIEVNTSCPNIPGSSPSGYTMASMTPLLQVLADAYAKDNTLTIGLKLPPYTFKEQFLQTLSTIDSLSTNSCPISFFTSTNTLGNCLLSVEQTSAASDEESGWALPTSWGGLAGEALHPLALGNVHMFSTLLKGGDYPRLQNIKIIGVGGVTSSHAFLRMKEAGADFVGCATFFGKEGVKAFEILALFKDLN